MRELSRRSSIVAAVASVPHMEVIENATFEHVISGKYQINSINPGVFKCEDVLCHVVLNAKLTFVRSRSNLKVRGGSWHRIDSEAAVNDVPLGGRRAVA
jgi:hypothetical protein